MRGMIIDIVKKSGRLPVVFGFLKLRESFETITGVSHDQVAFFKTFHGTTEIVQGRLSTVASPG